MIDGDLVEVQNQLPYSLSLPNAVVSKGASMSLLFCTFSPGSYVFYRVFLWLSAEMECYRLTVTSFSPVVWHEVDQKEKRRSREGLVFTYLL